MLRTNGDITIIPEKNLRKSDGVQFKQSFFERAEAVKYARERGYDLIVVCDEDRRYFDVMHNPDEDSQA
jgi:hypothetical protein